MRGRVIGATPSHTQAARTIHNTTPQQKFPPQPRPQSGGVVNRPANEVSTSSNEPKVIFHIQQTVSGNAAEPDENPRSEQSRPAYPGPTSTVSATKASTSTTSANDQSHFSQHHNGHSQRSGQPQPASPRPASTVSATEASTSTTSANDPSHFSQHHNGQSQRSAQLQPAPEQLEQTASSVTHKEPSLPSKTQALPASSDENAGTQPIMSDSTPLNKMKKCESPNTTNHNKNSDEESVNKWTFQLTKFPAPNPKNLPQNLLFVTDSNTNVIFLVDSGSEISILPKDLTNAINKYFPRQSRTILGFGNKTTHPIGSVDVELHLGELEPINHSFWVTQATRHFGIIGMDLLIKNQLAILPSTFQLCKMDSGKSAKPFAPADLPAPIVASVNHINMVDENTVPLEERCKQLLMEFPEITRKPTYHTKPKHNHELEIVLDDYKPTMVKARRPGGRRAAIQEHFDDLLHRGVVTRGDATEGASPVTCVQKKDNSMCVCVDYTVLNRATRPLSYPLPRNWKKRRKLRSYNR